MASRHPAKFAKRQKELDRKVKREEKSRRRAERQESAAGAKDTDIDPDIAGIVPGPQPREE
jgi:hypothetical protein